MSEVCAGFVGERFALRKIGEIAFRAGVVSGEKAARSEAVIEFAQEGHASHYIVVAVVGIAA